MYRFHNRCIQVNEAKVDSHIARKNYFPVNPVKQPAIRLYQHMNRKTITTVQHTIRNINMFRFFSTFQDSFA